MNRKSTDDNDIMIIYQSFLLKKNKSYSHTDIQKNTTEVRISGAVQFVENYFFQRFRYSKKREMNRKNEKDISYDFAVTGVISID